MSRIINVIPNKDYTLTISFSDGSRLDLNMRRQVETIQFHRLKQDELFEKVKFSDKSVFWPDDNPMSGIMPLRLTLDNILFYLRDSQQ